MDSDIVTVDFCWWNQADKMSNPCLLATIFKDNMMTFAKIKLIQMRPHISKISDYISAQHWMVALWRFWRPGNEGAGSLCKRCPHIKVGFPSDTLVSLQEFFKGSHWRLTDSGQSRQDSKDIFKNALTVISKSNAMLWQRVLGFDGDIGDMYEPFTVNF